MESHQRDLTAKAVRNNYMIRIVYYVNANLFVPCDPGSGPWTQSLTMAGQGVGYAKVQQIFIFCCCHR